MSELQEIGENDRLGDYARGRADATRELSAKYARLVECAQAMLDHQGDCGKCGWCVAGGVYSAAVANALADLEK